MADRGYTFNINLALDKAFETKPLSGIPKEKIEVLQGVGTKGQDIFQGVFGEGRIVRDKVETVRDLAEWKYYKIARALVDLKETEEEGKRDPKSEMNFNNALVKEYETKSLKEICAAPTSALQGISDSRSKQLEKAPLNVKTIEDLASLKYCRWAAAINELSEYEIADGASKAPSKAKQTKWGTLHQLIEANKKTAAQLDEVKVTHETNAELVAALEETQALLLDTKRQMQRQKEELEHHIEHTKKAWFEQGRKAEWAEQKFGAIFDKIDANSDGNLTIDEVKKYVKETDKSLELSLGIGRWEDFVHATDTDGDGEVSRQEFIEYFGSRELDVAVCYGAMFDQIDKNYDGELTLDELLSYEGENNKIFQLLGIWKSADGPGKGWESFVTAIAGESGRIGRDEFIDHFRQREEKGFMARREHESGPAAKRPRTA